MRAYLSLARLIPAVGLALALTIAQAYAAPTPTQFPGQQDGVFITDGSVIVQFNALDESHESFFPTATFPTPAGFLDATVFLAETGSICTPGAGNLGDCSDGLTLVSDPLDQHLDVFFVSDGASASELATFFANVSTNVFTLPETGFYQDVSAFFNMSPGFAFVQSDIPEPFSAALLAGGLLGAGVIRRRASRKQ